MTFSYDLIFFLGISCHSRNPFFFGKTVRPIIAPITENMKARLSMRKSVGLNVPNVLRHVSPTRRRILSESSPVGLNSLLILLCLGIGACISYWRGQDINFDQLNYHYYVYYAFRTHRLSQDVAPSQILHSFFSPIVYALFYFMVEHFRPYAVGMAIGALHGLNLWFIVIIMWIVTPTLRTAVRIGVVIAGVLISAASPMAISELGTSMSDLLVSLLVLAGLALLMRSGSDDDQAIPAVAWIGIGGSLVGAAVSLKLTSAAFAIALAAAALVGWNSWRSRLTAFMATVLGGGLGFAAAGGSWYLLMWRMFRNPTFPYFNAIFRSTDYPSNESVFDARHVPHNLIDALSYPFLWATPQQITSELPFRDIRFAVLIVSVLIAGGIRLVLRGRVSDLATTTPAWRRLFTFFVVAFCIWIYVWSIQRYIVVLELLTGPALVVVLQWSGLSRIRCGLPMIASVGALAIVCVATVQPTDWGHLAWNSRWYTVNIPPAANGHPIYFLDGEPLAYVVPELQPGSSAIEIIAWEDMRAGGDTIFVRRIKELLADPHNDVVRAIAAGPISDSFRQSIASYGLEVVDGECKRTEGRPMPLIWCPLTHISEQPHDPS